MTNKELDLYIEAFKSGDKEAFEAIYNETYKSVYYTIYLLVKNRDQIADFVQDTYLKAIEKIDTYQIGTNFKAWISRIGHNLCLNVLLKEGKEKTVDLNEESIETLKCIPEKDDRIETALAILSGEEKQVFIYLILEGLTIKEMAEELNVNLNRAYYLKNKMEEALKQIFKND